MYGVDVSKHNGHIDWRKAKASGVDFAIIRGGYGSSIDSKAHYNLSQCEALGIHTGLYWFSYSLYEEETISEAELCLQLARGYNLTMPIYYDLEQDSYRYAKEMGKPISKEKANAFTKAFCETIEKNNFYAGIYTNLNDYNTIFDNANKNRFTIWLAAWDRLPAVKCGIFQYRNKGIVPGFTGDVDLNICTEDFPGIITEMGLNK